jgi:hypothetical protein
MVPTTRDPAGFPSIRRRVWVGFCIHRSVVPSGANLVPSGFAGPGLVLLNPDLVPGPKLKQTSSSCIMYVEHQNWVKMKVMKMNYKGQILCCLHVAIATLFM